MTKPHPFKLDAREFADKRVLVTGGTKGLGAAIPQRLLAGGGRVAVTALRLLSARSSFITGQAICVDGGLLIGVFGKPV